MPRAPAPPAAPRPRQPRLPRWQRPPPPPRAPRAEGGRGGPVRLRLRLLRRRVRDIEARLKLVGEHAVVDGGGSLWVKHHLHRVAPKLERRQRLRAVGDARRDAAHQRGCRAAEAR
eukprot:5152506-Prymnesium_polylepis.1